MKVELKENITGAEIKDFQTIVDVKKEGKYLSFEFFCKNSKFFSSSSEYNGPLYLGDVCEAFLCTSGDVSHYYEIEVAPNNQVFLATIYNDGDYHVTFIEENFLKSEVEILNETDYRLKFSVPLDKIGYDEKIGILGNVYRIETEGGFTDKNLLAYNPTLKATFHAPEKFIKIL